MNKTNTPAYNVLGIGAACIDLMINIPDEFLEYVSGIKGGAQEIERSELDRILSLSGQTPLLTTGGSSANVIKCLAGLGESCGFFCCLGNDEYGKHFSKYLQKQNIKGIYHPSPYPNCCVLCMITPDGQRTMRFFEGSSKSISPHLLQPAYFSGIQLLHIDAYSLRQPELVERAMQLAKQNQALISIDLSSIEIVQEYAATLNRLLAQYAPIVFANADETRALTGLAPEEGCVQLQKLASVAIVMIGKDGCLVANHEGLQHHPTTPTHVVDSTGAGDFFAGGFLYGYLHQQSLATCAKWGNRMGRAIVEVTGAELPEEKWQRLRSD